MSPGMALLVEATFLLTCGSRTHSGRNAAVWPEKPAASTAREELDVVTITAQPRNGKGVVRDLAAVKTILVR